MACFFLFQAMFCGTATTIVSGAVAERMQFRGYLIVATFLSCIVYTFFGHWAWGGSYEATASRDAVTCGWLYQYGFRDFAGSTVVHGVGAWVALAVVLQIGPRTGRFKAKGESASIHGHDLPIAILGALLLWLGWFGFNGGSIMAMDYRVPLVIVNTVIASAAGLIAALFLGWWLSGRAQVHRIINGALAGLVSITACCNAVGTVEAVIIGAFGGVVMLVAEYLLERLKIDDVVGAISVHGAAGAWGTIAVAIFADYETLGVQSSFASQLGAQLLGIITCFIWSFGCAWFFVKGINTFMPLRVSAEAEHQGLNVSEHQASTEILDLFEAMDRQASTGDLSVRVPVEPFTEVGQLAERYNRVMGALEEAIAQTNAIVRTATDGIVTFAKDALQILSVNPSLARMFGYSANQLDRQPVTLLFGDSSGGDGTLLQRAFPGIHLDRPLTVTGVREDG